MKNKSQKLLLNLNSPKDLVLPGPLTMRLKKENRQRSQNQSDFNCSTRTGTKSSLKIPHSSKVQSRPKLIGLEYKKIRNKVRSTENALNLNEILHRKNKEIAQLRKKQEKVEVLFNKLCKLLEIGDYMKVDLIASIIMKEFETEKEIDKAKPSNLGLHEILERSKALLSKLSNA